MKKLLSLLSVLTIGGTAVPITIAASPYQKEEIKLENSDINYQQTNNLKTLNRTKRENNNEVVISTQQYGDKIIFVRNDFDFKWETIWGLNWILKINHSGMLKIINFYNNHPDMTKKMGSIVAGIMMGAAASYATDYLSQIGYSWPTTAVYFTQTAVGLASAFATYKVLGSRIFQQIINVIKNPNFKYTAVWVAFNANRPKEDSYGVSKNNVDETTSISSSDSYYTASDDNDVYLNLIN